jgi:hypothetical protein
MAEILLLSKNESMYTWFLSNFLKNGVGGKTWNHLHLRIPISKFVTPSTEAIVLLIFENNYNRWLDEAQNGSADRKNLAPSLYTNGGISQRGGRATSKQGGGWSQAGIERFNELVKNVKEDRKDRTYFEMALMKKLNDDNTVKSWSSEKIKPVSTTVEEEVIAVNDFDDDKEYLGLEDESGLSAVGV